MNYETAPEIEVAVSRYFGVRTHTIVPNVSWGMFNYELDLCVLNNKSLYAQEVEIKISKSDLKRDAKKVWHHNYFGNHGMIRCLWFAMPEKLRNCADLVPAQAGILLVDATGKVTARRRPKPEPNAKRWTYADAYKLARLGTLRVWSYKHASVDRMQSQQKAAAKAAEGE